MVLRRVVMRFTDNGLLRDVLSVADSWLAAALLWRPTL